MSHLNHIYQRVGEFVISFQWTENKLREIGWFILDPQREEWPPVVLRNLTTADLIDRVHRLFVVALPKCQLPSQLEADFRDSFTSTVNVLHELRRDRNRILHSTFIELKASGEVQGLLRSNPTIQVDEETGESLFDHEILTPESFAKKMKVMANTALFLNRVHLQLIHAYPHNGCQDPRTSPT